MSRVETCCFHNCEQGDKCPLRQPEVTARASAIAATLIAASLLALVCLYAYVQHQDSRDAAQLQAQIAGRK